LIGTAPVESMTFNLVVEAGTFVPDLPPEGSGDCGGPGLAGYLGVGLGPSSDPIGRAGRTSDETGESWYGLSVDAPAMLRIDAASDEIDTVVEVLGPDGAAMHENDDFPGLGTNSRVEAAFEPGEYCVKVRGFAGARGGYTLAVAPMDETAPPDTSGGGVGAGPCGDPALTRVLAQVLTLRRRRPGWTAQPTPGSARGGTACHWPRRWSFRFRPPAANGYRAGTLRRSGGLLVENDDYPGMGTDSRIDASLDPGAYCVLVRGFADAAGPFTVALSIAGGPAAAPDLPYPKEADEIEDLGLLAEVLRSYAVTADPALFAMFAVNEPGPVVIEGVSVSSAFRIALYDADADLMEATEMTPAFGAATLTLDLPVSVYIVGLVNETMPPGRRCCGRSRFVAPSAAPRAARRRRRAARRAAGRPRPAAAA
jgi:hypothetical protein